MAVVVGVAVASGGWLVAQPAGAAGALTAAFAKTSDWGNGYVADYTVANSGAPVQGWTLRFTVPRGTVITSAWSGDLSRSGTQYTITNAAWNGTVGTGGTAQVGFQTTYTGTFSPPTDCTINGLPCDGSTSTTTTTVAPTTTTSTTVPPTTTTTTTVPPTTTTTVPPTTTTTTTPSASGWWATFDPTDDWGTGYVADYTLGNDGSPVQAWTLTFTLPSTETVTDAWDGNLTQSGTRYTITNADWDGTVGTGGSVEIGFEGNYGGTLVAPQDCQVNGQPCTSGPSNGGGSGSTTTTTTTGGGSGPPVIPLPPLAGATPFPFAPYIDTTAWPTFDPTTDMATTGTKYFTLGFVVSQGTCTASWGGYYPVSSGYYQSEIQSVRANGGDVSVSFGGEAGTELADSCTTASALEAQYQSVVTDYDVTHIDFDIEGADVGNAATIALRFQALAALEAADPDLSVSLTLPVLPTGLDNNGLGVVKAAIAAGVRVDMVNVMAMDYGDSTAPDPAGQMGTYAIDAAQATHAQLAALYTTLSSAQVWSMVGVTPLIGVNDQTDEVFEPADASQLLAFARQVHLGRLSMWAATRDNECAGGAQTYSSDACSSIVQQPFAFEKIWGAYTG